MVFSNVKFTGHAIQRMFERSISIIDVHYVLANGEVIENYPTDFPYPSQLILGWRGNRPLHIVAADNSVDQETIVVTVYEPDSNEWELDFKKRKP